MPKIHLVPSAPVHVGPRRETYRPLASSFTVGAPREGVPVAQLDRVAKYAQSALGGTSPGSELAQISAAQWYRLLTPLQIDLIYQRCPDVRSSINQIVWQIACHAWDVVPTVDQHDPQYDAALAACLPIKRWLRKPTTDGFTWQEVMIAFLTDLLKHDAGAFERVRDRKGRLVEAVPIRGPDVHPQQDDRGRLDHYVQVPYTPSTVDFASTGSSVRLEPEQVLYMNLFPSTLSPEGQPLLEALVSEVVALMRAADYWAHSVDINEIPPGILVLVGVADQTAERMRAEYESKAASDWKIRILSSPRQGDVGAEWVRFQRDPKELQIAELCDEIRRTVWRVFGVKPVEQGATEGVNRATAQVQVDASDSHLIQPILELLAAKVNMLLVAELVPPELLDLVEFRWVVHKELTEAERLDRARRIDLGVRNGTLTVNEGRAEEGRKPYEDLENTEGGDVPLVVDGTSGFVPLTMILQKPERQEAQDEAAAEAAAQAAEGGGSGGGAGEADPEGGDAPGDDAVDEAAARPTPKQYRGIRYARPAPSGRAIGDDPPPGWKRDDVRAALTVDLDGLWSEMQGYWLDVDPLWERAKEAVLEAIAAEPKLDAAARAAVAGELANELSRLATEWALVSRSRYRAVAEASRRAVGNWAGSSASADEVRAEADAYHLRAMGYLTADDGLLVDLSREVMRILTEDYDGAVRAVPGGTSVTAAVTAVARAWDGLRHRIGNWVSKLIALANVTLSAQARRAASGWSTADPLWAEWADVGGPSECPGCTTLGSSGWIELSVLGTQVPADGTTECGANCRCVLRLFRRSEIDAGTAQLVGFGNQPVP